MRKAVFYIVAIFIGVVFSSSPDSFFVAKRRAFYESWNVKLTLSNDDVQVQIHPPSGRFTIGTTDGKPLLYGFPYGGGTSHIHFNVDGVVKGAYETPSPDRPEPAPMITSPHIVSGSAVCAWEFGGIRFRQILRPVYIGQNALIKIEYEVTNVDAIPHNAGILLFFDTMIGNNDMAPVSTPSGYSANEQQFCAPDVPSFWQAFELSPFQPTEMLMGIGILFGWSATQPDLLICGDYWNYRGVFWDVSFVGGTFNDSSVLMRWGMYTLAPSETRHIVTYYGKGSYQSLSGLISLSMTSPEQILPYGCGGFEPDTFFVSLFASAMDTLTDCVVGLTLPDFLVPVSSPAVSGVTLRPGVVAQFVWRVAVSSLSYSSVREGHIVAYVTPPIGSPASVSRDIEVLPGGTEPPSILVVERHDDILCGVPSRWQWIVRDDDGVVRNGVMVLLDDSPVPYLWYGETLEVRVAPITLGTHTLTISHVSDSNGCSAEPMRYSFNVSAPEVRASLINPRQGVFWSCNSDTVVAYLSGIAVSNIYCDAFPLAVSYARSDTYFVPLPVLFDGTHNITIMGRVCGRDTTIQWSFATDFSPPVVQPASLVLTLTSPMDVLSFVVSDNLSGVDFGSIKAVLSTGADSVVLSYGSPGFSVSGSFVHITLGNSGLAIAGCDTVSIRILAGDLAVGCGGNMIDTVVQKILVPCSSPVANVISPSSPLSCDTMLFSVKLDDADGIILDSVWVRIDGIVFSRDEIIISADTLSVRVPLESHSDGNVLCEIGGIYDIWLNRLDTAFSFMLDRMPPLISSIEPLPSSNLTGVENIRIQITDTGAGVDVHSIYVTLGDDTLPVGLGCTYDGLFLSISPCVWLSEVFGEARLRVCVHVSDMVVGCSSNLSDSCWEYSVTRRPTVISALSPHPGSWLGCLSHTFLFVPVDPDGIDWASVRISYNGNPVGFTRSGDTLGFELNVSELDNNSQVSVAISLSDLPGFPAETLFTYFIDREPPRVVPLVNWGTSLPSYYSPIAFAVGDVLSGLNTEFLTLRINGGDFTLSSSALELSGDTLKFFPENSGLAFSGFVEFEVLASDDAFGCPNRMSVGGMYEFLEPHIWWSILCPVGVSACQNIDVKVFVGSRLLLDFANVSAVCNDRQLPVSVSSDTISVTVPSEILSNGDNYLVMSGFAVGGRVIYDTIFIPIIFDNLPPAIIPVYPSGGQNALPGTPVILVISDDISGVDRNSVDISFNGLVPDGISWRGDTVIVVPPSNISGNVEICVSAGDKPQYCGPNTARVCWNYFVVSDNPTISVIEPPVGVFTHNRRQRISWRILDQYGIENQSLWVLVNGRRYDIGSSELAYTNGVLTFAPSFEYHDGDTVKWSVSARNVLGLESVSFGSFICDFSPPRIYSPSPSGVITSIPSEISVCVVDDGAGVDPASISFRVGDLWVEFDNYTLTYEYPRVILDVHGAGIFLRRGDSVVVCVSAADMNTGFGTPNRASDFCFSFLPVVGECSVSPNPFTPNGDGINDFVEIFAPTDKQFETKIFTLTGSLVWESKDYGIAKWCGMDNNGHPAPVGTYLYVITQDGRTICKGFIVLAR